MSYLDGEVGWESLVESEMNRDVTVKKVVAENMKGWRHIALNRARWASEVGEVSDIDRKLVELDKVVDGVGGEASGVGAESELGRAGQDKRVVDGNCGVGGGGHHDVVGLLVPHHRTVRRPPATARGLVGLSEIQSSDLHGSACGSTESWIFKISCFNFFSWFMGYLGLRFDLGFESFSSIFVGLLIFLDFGDED
ncbi:hypothetical protein ACFXTH_041868 [Malus domestica]